MKKFFKKFVSLLLVVITVVAMMSALNINAAINKSTYDSRVAAFIADSRWKNGISWTAIKPKYSTYSSSGCCAYCADFAAYVYGSKSSA